MKDDEKKYYIVAARLWDGKVYVHVLTRMEEARVTCMHMLNSENYVWNSTQPLELTSNKSENEIEAIVEDYLTKNKDSVIFDKELKELIN